MRIAFLADIHSNLQALEAVIKKLKTLGEFDAVFVAGDIVGYGANPKECIQIIKNLSSYVCMGNHDSAVAGIISPETFNSDAKIAVEWTRNQLSTSELEWLSSLPLIVNYKEINWTIVHGSLINPESYIYLASYEDAEECFAKQETRFCLVGHTHTPLVFAKLKEEKGLSGAYLEPGKLKLNSQIGKIILNSGSVGQPRDGDPRASFAIYDSDKDEIEIFRVSYDIKEATNRILDASLPESLALRLYQGW